MADDLKAIIRSIPDHPKPGIVFRDITTLLKDPGAFQTSIDLLLRHSETLSVNKVVGIESRGFLFGSILAHQLGVGFIPVRKSGKLPAATVGQDYELEYGRDRLEVHKDAIDAGDSLLLVDDLIATGGTAEAAVKLLQGLGGRISQCCFVIELPELGGRRRLEHIGQTVHALCEFEGH